MIFIHINIYTYIQTNNDTHRCLIHWQTRTPTNTLTYTHTNTHIHPHTLTHTHWHKHTRTQWHTHNGIYNGKYSGTHKMTHTMTLTHTYTQIQTTIKNTNTFFLRTFACNIHCVFHVCSLFSMIVLWMFCMCFVYILSMFFVCGCLHPECNLCLFFVSVLCVFFV